MGSQEVGREGGVRHEGTCKVFEPYFEGISEPSKSRRQESDMTWFALWEN